MSAAPYDVLAFAAHPDDLEAVMGGTAAKLTRKGRSILFVDLCDGEPARYAEHGKRAEQAAKAAAILGVDRFTMPLRDRLIRDTTEARLGVARLIRLHRPRLVFTTSGSGVHPDHQAVTEIDQFLSKISRYSELRRGVPGRVYGPFAIAVRAAWAFVRSYVFQLGFVEGWRGLVIAVSTSNGSFYKHMKAYVDERLRHEADQSGRGRRELGRTVTGEPAPNRDGFRHRDR